MPSITRLLAMAAVLAIVQSSDPDANVSKCVFKEFEVLRFICTKLMASEIGAIVDSIYKSTLAYVTSVSLALNSIEFPNGTIGPNWYNGSIDISYLIMTLDTVTVIEDNAFDTPAFHPLQSISLILNAFVEIKGGIFNGLSNLKWLKLSTKNGFGAYVCHRSDQLFKPFHNSIEIFANFIANHPFQDYYGAHKMTRLQRIGTSNPRSTVYPRVLSNIDFTGLATIAELILNQCDIEAILENTFDYIGATLADLDLGGNNIKHMTFDMLHTFLDSPLIFEYLKKIFHMGDNLLECTCDFYLIKNITLISFGSINVPDRYISCHASARAHSANDLMCEDIQIINSRKFHLDYPFKGIHRYAYLNVQLKFRRDNFIVLRQFKPRPYRLWIHNPGESNLIEMARKCPNKKWSTESVKCLRFTKQEVSIPIDRFIMKSRFTIFCVIYLQYPQKTWPLHCTTKYNAISDDDESPDNIQWIFLFGIIAGILTGFFIRICGKWR